MDRLYPPRYHRTYWHLTSLRREIERVAAEFLSSSETRNARLIDFGAGDAPYARILSKLVKEYVPCDLPGRSETPKLSTSPDSLPFAEASAQIVLSTQVLEHCADPSKYLNEARRVLCDQGLLIMSTHGVWRYHPDPIDRWRWTSAGLRHIVEERGFSILSFRGVQGPEAIGLQLWQDAVISRIPNRLVRPFGWVMQRWMEYADKRCPQSVRDEDASVFVVVAKKV